MRLKYYRLSLRQMKFKKSFVFFLIFVLVILLLSIFITKKIEPQIKTLCETRARSIALSTTNEVVNSHIKNITYDTLVDIKKNDQGKVIALTADVMEMNRLSNLVSSDVQKKLNELKDSYIKLPLGSMLNFGIFSGYGPSIKIKVVPTGNVSAKFKSEFEQAGVNQTRHKIYLEVSTKVRVIAPFNVGSQEYVNDITVAETIIVGDTPGSYYYINGLDVQDTIIDD